MARKIIILETSPPPRPGETMVRFAMWADVPAARQSRYADATFATAVAGATAPEITALQNGSVVEKVEEARWPTGVTIPQIQAFLVTRFQAFQAEITAANPWQRYGTNWDGTQWNMVNNG